MEANRSPKDLLFATVYFPSHPKNGSKMCTVSRSNTKIWLCNSRFINLRNHIVFTTTETVVWPHEIII